jgi:hypothetical protein
LESRNLVSSPPELEDFGENDWENTDDFVCESWEMDDDEDLGGGLVGLVGLEGMEPPDSRSGEGIDMDMDFVVAMAMATNSFSLSRRLLRRVSICDIFYDGQCAVCVGEWRRVLSIDVQRTSMHGEQQGCTQLDYLSR